MLDDIQPKPTYQASIVRVEVRGRVETLVIAKVGEQAVEKAKIDIAIALAKAMMPLIQEIKTPGHVELALPLSLLMPTEQVPKGMAHTPIIFQEAPR